MKCVRFQFETPDSACLNVVISMTERLLRMVYVYYSHGWFKCVYFLCLKVINLSRFIIIERYTNPWNSSRFVLEQLNANGHNKETFFTPTPIKSVSDKEELGAKSTILEN